MRATRTNLALVLLAAAGLAACRARLPVPDAGAAAAAPVAAPARPLAALPAVAGPSRSEAGEGWRSRLPDDATSLLEVGLAPDRLQEVARHRSRTGGEGFLARLWRGDFVCVCVPGEHHRRPR